MAGVGTVAVRPINCASGLAVASSCRHVTADTGCAWRRMPRAYPARLAGCQSPGVAVGPAWLPPVSRHATRPARCKAVRCHTPKGFRLAGGRESRRHGARRGIVANVGEYPAAEKSCIKIYVKRCFSRVLDALRPRARARRTFRLRKLRIISPHINSHTLRKSSS